jgi:hypothetical protein
MTLTRLIVIDALRESMLVGLGEEGDAAQGEEGLRLLSRIVKSVFGNQVGENLQDWAFPPVYPTAASWQYIPPDTRIVMGANAGGQSFNINPYPENGDRLQLIDAGSNFATNHVTLIPGPATFNGSSSNYIANANGFNKTWLYRADIGDWALVAPLDAAGEFPFPEEHDDAFIGMLATRLSPRYRQQMAPESVASLTSALSQLRARYSRARLERADLAVLRLTGTVSRSYLGEERILYGR